MSKVTYPGRAMTPETSKGSAARGFRENESQLKTTEAACRTCVYSLERESDLFICKRYPPAIIQGKHKPEFMYPMMPAADWCGEWEPREFVVKAGQLSEFPDQKPGKVEKVPA